MARTEELKNVPKREVGDTVDDFIADGATKVTVNKNPTSGKWKIKATFP